MTAPLSQNGSARGGAPPAWLALLTGTLALLLCVALGRFTPREALLSYLFAFLFFTGLSVGSIAIAMVHAMTGGSWGYLIRPYLAAAARVLPLQAALSLPLLIGVRIIYPWAAPAAAVDDAALQAQSWYLNPTFFTLRTVAYFAVWLLFSSRLQRGFDKPERLSHIAASGLIAYTLTSSLAAIDWVMSLTPQWHSTVFGMMIATGWMLSATALAVLCTSATGRSHDTPPPTILHDLGNLLLVMILSWSYLAFMQYLTVWIADIPGETSWYIPRTLTSWRVLAWFLIAIHFAIPFAVLLSRRAKRHRGWLSAVAALLLIAHLVDALWLVVPNLHPGGMALSWTDLLAPIGIGSLWLFVFLRQLHVSTPHVYPMRPAVPQIRSVGA